MKAVYKKLMLLAAITVVTGAAMAKDEHNAFQQGVTTNSTTPFVLMLKPEPSLQAGSNRQFTGLFVDLIRPQATWSLLNPTVPARVVPNPPQKPELLLPVAPARPNNDLQIHDANFVVLKLSFP